jgi:hypothetical protein
MESISKNHLIILSIWEDPFTKRSKEYYELSDLLSPMIAGIREVVLTATSNWLHQASIRDQGIFVRLPSSLIH